MAVKNFEPTEDELDYVQSAQELKEPPSKLRSYLGAFPRGVEKSLSEEASGLRELMEMLPFGLGEQIEKANIGMEQVGFTPEEKIQQIEERFPIREGYVEKSLERGGKVAPLLALGGAGPLEAGVRSVAAGGFGQAAEELGLGPLGQALAELPAYLAPDLSKLIPTGEEELAAFARSKGLIEEDLPLVLGDKGAIKEMATEVAAKGPRTARAFEATKGRLGRVWETLRSSPEAQFQLSGKQSSNLINNISNRLKQLPDKMRKLIENDFKDLIGSDMKLDDVINFWQDLNYYIRSGEKGLGVIKEDLTKAINQVSPELGKDFRLTNQLYGNFGELASKMHPKMAETLIQAGERGMLMAGVVEGNFPLIKQVLGAVGARQLATEMVKNPRLQRLASRFSNAITRNRPAIAKTVISQMAEEVGKKDADAAKMIAELDVDELFQAIEEED